jgi:hypothetical protein
MALAKEGARGSSGPARLPRYGLCGTVTGTAALAPLPLLSVQVAVTV